MRPIESHHRLDVRRLLRDGVEPFPMVLAALRALPTGAALTLVAPFLPSPLIELLEGEGFLSRIERGKGSDWWITVWHP